MNIPGGQWGMVGILMILCIIVITLFFSQNVGIYPEGNWTNSSFSNVHLTLYTEELPPFNYIDRQGKIYGRSTEIIREIAKRTDSDVTIHLVPWSDGYNKVLSEPGTAIFSTVRTHERDNVFKWVGPIASVEYAFYGREEDNLQIHCLNDVERAGVVSVIQNDARHQLLARRGMTNLMVLSDERACIAALADGKADLWFGTKESYAQNAIQIGDNMNRIKLVWPYMTVGLNIGFNRNTPDSTIIVWQKTLDNMKKDGTYEMIQDRYMPYICSWVKCTS